MKSLFEKNNLIIGITLLVASLLMLTIWDVQSQTEIHRQTFLLKKCSQTSGLVTETKYTYVIADTGSKTSVFRSIQTDGNQFKASLFIPIIQTFEIHSTKYSNKSIFNSQQFMFNT